MQALLVEVNHPEYGLERYKIKIIRRFNVPTTTLKPVIKKRLSEEQLSRLIVGRGVSEKEIIDYVIEHFKKRGIWERILMMKIV